MREGISPDLLSGVQCQRNHGADRLLADALSGLLPRLDVSAERAELTLKAAALWVAVDLGPIEVANMLIKIARELEASQWEGPGSR